MGSQPDRRAAAWIYAGGRINRLQPGADARHWRFAEMAGWNSVIDRDNEARRLKKECVGTISTTTWQGIERQ